MKTFISSTVGLTRHHKLYKTPKLVRVQFYRLEDSSVILQSVSGHSLSMFKKVGTVTISAEDFENFPYDPHNDLVEAEEAMNLLGWH